MMYKMLYRSRQDVVNIVTCLSTTSYPTVRAKKLQVTLEASSNVCTHTYTPLLKKLSVTIHVPIEPTHISPFKGIKG